MTFTPVHVAAVTARFAANTSGLICHCAAGFDYPTADERPAIISAAATVGSAFSFQVTWTGFPFPTVTASGALPVGVTFDAHGQFR